MRKSRLWMLLAAGALLVYHFDVITGTLKFNRMCKAEGGPRFYGPVEKDVGWEVTSNDTEAFTSPFLFNHIAFVRYRDKAGVRSDVRLNGYTQVTASHAEPNYVFLPVNEAQQVRYRFERNRITFPDDERFSKSVEKITDLASGKVVVTYTTVTFQWTKPERVILGATTADGCWDKFGDGDFFVKNIYEFRRK
jgi:hypothetical protein